MLAVTLILIAVLSAISLNYKRRIYFLEYLNHKLPSADTDEDVIGVLEASGAEIAPKLLEAAETARKDADWHHDSGSETPVLAQWEWLLKDLTMEDSDEQRLEVLRQWIIRGFEVTIYESVMICEFFETPEARTTARKLISESMVGRSTL